MSEENKLSADALLLVNNLASQLDREKFSHEDLVRAIGLEKLTSHLAEQIWVLMNQYMYTRGVSRTEMSSPGIGADSAPEDQAHEVLIQMTAMFLDRGLFDYRTLVEALDLRNLVYFFPHDCWACYVRVMKSEGLAPEDEHINIEFGGKGRQD